MNSKLTQLALCGGTPTIENGPPAWPQADPDVQAALAASYASGDWGRYHGPNTEALQTKLAELHSIENVKLCSSGTIAVELALRGLDIPADSEVILGGYDFPGNFHCIEHVGARPVLADIDATNGCLNVEQLDAAYSPSVRAIVVSHLHSGMAPMKSIMEWAQSKNVFVIEDACQSPGALANGQLAGTWGDIGVLSFGGSKLLTSGRGGAVLVKDPIHLQRMRVFSDRGNDACPLSELQAAVVLPQLEKLEVRNTTRHANVVALSEKTNDIGCLKFMGATDTDDPSSYHRPSYYKVAWHYDPQAGKWTREEFMGALRAEGVAVDGGFRGFARRSAKRCRHAGDLANSKRAASNTVLLHHPVLLETPETIDAVATAIRKVVNGYVGSA